MNVRHSVIALALSLAACNASFDVDVESESTIPKGNLFENLLAVSFGDFSSIDLSQTQGFKNAGVAKEDVDSVKLASVVLSVKAPAGETFEFIDRIEFFVSAEGVPEKRIAFKLEIPDDATTVTLDLDDVELAPYVTAPTMAVTTKATAHRPQADTTVHAKLVFSVDPKIL